MAGYCLQPPGATPTVTTFYARHLPLLVTCLAVAALAVTVLTAAVATRLAMPADSGPRQRLSRLGATLAVLVTLTTAWSAVTSSVATYLLLKDVASVRGVVLGLGSDRAWRYTPSLILVGLALIVLRTRRPRLGRAVVAVTVVAAVVGGAAASLSWLLRVHGQSDDTNYVMVYQRWWICALAGLVAALAVMLANRRRDDGTLAELPPAVVSGLVATTLAGVIQYVAVRVHGYAKDSDVFQQSLQLPGWLLVVALIVTLPVTLPLVGGATTHRDLRRGAGFWAVGAGGATVLLVLTLLGGALSWVTVAEHDRDRGKSIASAVNAHHAPGTPVAPGDHGRTLDQAAVTAALAHVPTLLPPDAKIVDNPSADPSTVTPATCDAMIKRRAATEKAMARTADLERTYEFPAEATVDGGSVSASVTSYVTPPAGFSDLDDETRECAHFRSPQDTHYDGGYLDGYLSPGRLPELPYEARRRNFSLTGRIHGAPVVIVVQQYVAVVGHNVVDVTLSWAYGQTPPSRAALQRFDQLVMSTINGVIRAL